MPLFGFALLGLSSRAYRLDDGWVLWGLVLWVVATLGAEGLLWPAERRVQVLLSAERAVGSAAPELRQACLTVCLTAGGLAAVLVLATVLMVAQP